MKKKDQRYNTPLDNYSSRYSDNLKLVLFYVIVGGAGYGLYQLYLYLF
jgi:hypothetical protein